jgi:hypothetical protein
MAIRDTRYLKISQSVWLIKITITVILYALAGCSSPTSRFHLQAEKRGLERQVDNDLVIYQRGNAVAGQPIHIYLDGDGTPSLGRGRIARDPTTRDRLILDLIDADPSYSVLIGRPCYYGNKKAGCVAEQWTSARYSQFVVERLVVSINAIVRRYPTSSIILIGYSGGGTLAMLAAPKIERLDALVTIAANLDTQVWVEHHGYAPLQGSLNPADQPPLRSTIKQFHFFGADDQNVPVSVARRVIDQQQNAEIELVAGYGHRCCWPDIWASSISRIRRQLD